MPGQPVLIRSRPSGIFYSPTYPDKLKFSTVNKNRIFFKNSVIPWLDHGTQVIYSYIMSFEQKYYYVYIMASSKNGTLYIGFTSNLPQRIFEHKNHLLPGFTNKYNVDKLVYFERFEDVNQAIRHEKRLKEWKRNWKKDLIEKHNPQWRDLYDDLNNLL